jgi:DNA-binding MarR family transcriptional regulator
MPGLFDPNEQHGDLDGKLVAGLERLGQALRGLLRAEAASHGLSPIQLQLLVQVSHNGPELSRVGALAERFDVTAPTVSDAVKALMQKGLVRREPAADDARAFELVLTPRGERVAAEAAGWAEEVRRIVAQLGTGERRVAFAVVARLIEALHRQGVITVARMCRTCCFLRVREEGDAPYWCGLLDFAMDEADLRIDCPDHQPLQPSG